MRNFLTIFFSVPFIVIGQTFTTNPSFPQADQPMTLTVDVSCTRLDGYNGDVWLWAWLPNCSSNCDAITNVDPATSAQSAAKMSRVGTNVYALTFVPTNFFGKSKAEIDEIGFKLKSVRWSDERQSDNDRFINISNGDLEIQFTSPSTDSKYVFVNIDEPYIIQADASVSADLKISIDEQAVATTTGQGISHSFTPNEIKSYAVSAQATLDGQTVAEDFTLIVRSNDASVPRPAGIKQGINYSVDETEVTLCFIAPNKLSAYVIGEFNDWQPSADYKMNRDGNYFWITISNLEPGREYGFQYLVDESIITGDPYADKILDPWNDPFISEESYPALKNYPADATGLVSVFQTGQADFEWQHDNYNRPNNEDLVIYEVLIRDFDSNQNLNDLYARLDYIDELGVNAIQLMPVMEFSGNLSWGYNPSYFFAPDKYYGSRQKLKEFIDECHRRGIAVILDMVLNHTWGDHPFAQMYWDECASKPSNDNPWLNRDATHPFNVFNDFNHESLYTQHFVDTVNHYWLNEYHFDGYRFDLSKGFTQVNSGDNVGAWSAYDQSRVNILKRMVDRIWEHTPDAYVIFEHLADNSEEKVLADYGIMMWGNMNHNFNQLTMGYSQDSNIEWAYHGTRNWNAPNLIAYMESHDEERLMYRNKQSGNTTNPGHNVKTLNIGLERIKPASAIYYCIPGPKMIWQFGELGYDISIEQNGRTGEKPIPWTNGLGYEDVPNRLRLKDLTAELVKMKTSYSVFGTTDFSLNQNQSLVKQVILKNSPYTSSPSSTAQMNVVTVSNFNVTTTSITMQFPHDGIWYDYFANKEIQVTGGQYSIDFQPAEFRLYTDVKLGATSPELTNYVPPLAASSLVAEETNMKVKLTWVDDSQINTSYSVYRKSSGAYELLTNLISTATTYIDSNIEPETTYTYKVVANSPHYLTESLEVSILTSSLLSVDGLRVGESIFPNPVFDKINISNVASLNSAAIIDMQGKVIPLELIRGDKVSQIDMNNISRGLYLLMLYSEDRIIQIKILKE